MNRFSAMRHNAKFSKMGTIFRQLVGWAALKTFRLSRKLLKWTLYRCSWCGSNCGMDSTISKKGLRCCNLRRQCWTEPDV